MRLEKLDDPHDFAKLVEKLIQELGPQELRRGEIWWRGQSKSGWELLPSVYRENRNQVYEKNITAGFISKAPARYAKDCPSLADAASWLILMQHYGLPTRLLDWTESPLVALFFAVLEHDCVPGALWVLYPYKLNEDSIDSIGREEILNPQIDRIQPIFKASYASMTENTNKTVAVMAPHTDLRVLVQQSAFTVHGSRTALNKLQNKDEFLLKIEIPAEQKPGFRTYLRDLGINISSLFPDLEHLARSLVLDEDLKH